MLLTQRLISMLLSYNPSACFACLIKHKTCHTGLADVRFLLIHFFLISIFLHTLQHESKL